MQAGLSSVQKLHQFVEEVLLPNVQNKSLPDAKAERIFIFIDEIDSFRTYALYKLILMCITQNNRFRRCSQG